MNLPKEIELQIQELVSKMPVVMEWKKEIKLYTKEEATEAGYEDIDERRKKVLKTRDGKKKEVYIFEEPVQIACNHYRRCVRAYKRGGEPAVFAYALKINNIILEQQKENA